MTLVINAKDMRPTLLTGARNFMFGVWSEAAVYQVELRGVGLDRSESSRMREYVVKLRREEYENVEE